MNLAVVDLLANIGAGRRFTSGIVRGLTDVCPDYQIRLITSREAVENLWFGNLEQLPVDIVGLVTDSTLDHWLPAGRIGGLPGTWLLKLAFRRSLRNTLFGIERQLRHHLKGIDAIYWPWPSFAYDSDWQVPNVMTVHDLLWEHLSLLSEVDQHALDGRVARWLTQGAATVAITNVLLQEIEQFYAGCARRIEVIPQPAPILPAPLQGVQRERFLARSEYPGRIWSVPGWAVAAQEP